MTPAGVSKGLTYIRRVGLAGNGSDGALSQLPPAASLGRRAHAGHVHSLSTDTLSDHFPLEILLCEDDAAAGSDERCERTIRRVRYHPFDVE